MTQVLCIGGSQHGELIGVSPGLRHFDVPVFAPVSLCVDAPTPATLNYDIERYSLVGRRSDGLRVFHLEL